MKQKTSILAGSLIVAVCLALVGAAVVLMALGVCDADAIRPVIELALMTIPMGVWLLAKAVRNPSADD
jgi:hypothetical protein